MSNYKCTNCKHRVLIYSPYLHALVPSCDSELEMEDSKECFEPKDKNDTGIRLKGEVLIDTERGLLSDRFRLTEDQLNKMSVKRIGEDESM